MQPNLPPFTDLPDHNPSHLLPQLLGQGGLNIPFEPNKFGMFNGLIGKFPLSCGTANAITELRRDMDQPGRPHYLWVSTSKIE